MPVTDAALKQGMVAAPERRSSGVLRALSEFLRDFRRTAFDTYRPERHYMRGPGPACAEKRRARSPR